MIFRPWTVCAVILIVAMAVPASAQRARTIDNMVSRPSTRGPSQALGGRFTQSDTQAIGDSSRGISLLGQQSGMGMQQRRVSEHARVLSSVTVGLQSAASMYTVSSMTGLGRMGQSDIARLSGVGQLTRLDLPLPGVAHGYLPRVDAHEFTPAPEGQTRFHELFGLQPTRKLTAVELDELPKMADVLMERVDRRVAAAQEEGVELFREATVETRDPTTGQYLNCPDCAERLTRALNRLELVCVLDNDAVVPNLLVAHGQLEQDRPDRAVVSLLDAYMADPDKFLEAIPSLDQYFGDGDEAGDRSPFLEMQMVRYLRIGDANPGSVNAKLLEAYCARQLGDTVRARLAATEAERYVRESVISDGRILALARALQEPPSKAD